MIVGMFFSAAGGKSVAFIATEDIGVFAGKALLKPDDPAFKNTKIDLAAGSYDINDVSRAVEKAQGHTPWFARYTPTAIRNLLPHDFKEMMKCRSGPLSFVRCADASVFDNTGYPAIDVDALRQIHPDLMSFEDWFRKNAPK
jgi:hypothetical protein